MLKKYFSFVIFYISSLQLFIK